MFVPGKPLQPSLVFVGKARAYPSEEHRVGRNKFYDTGPSAEEITRLKRTGLWDRLYWSNKLGRMSLKKENATFLGATVA